MPEDSRNQSSPFSQDQSNPIGDDQEQKPKLQIKPGDLAPFWYSPYPNVVKSLSSKARLSLKSMTDMIGNKDVAARRWEVEQAWESRLFDRGYQYLLPRRGGGWILPPFSTDYNRGSGKKGGMKWYGYETNIYATYGEIITAALTRDIPEVRFEPQNPESDIDKTASDSAGKYARYFSKTNDLLELQHQLVYYLRTDGRAIIIMDHVLDAQRFGRCDPMAPEVNPETEGQEEIALAYLVRHGETQRNADDITRGQSDVSVDQSGQRENADASGFLKKKGVNRIIASPVERALESGQQHADSLGVPLEVDDRFAARDLGPELEGQPSEEAGKVLEENSQEPQEPLPGGGEPQDELDNRVRDGLFDLLGAGTSAPPAVVTHDSVIASAFRLFHGDQVPPTDLVPPGGVAGIFPVQGGGFSVRPVFPDIEPRGMLPAEKGEPRGIEIAEVVGKLEGKVLINAQGQPDLPYVQVSREYDYAYAKAMFPDFADDIRPGSAGAGENELDRIARINACLALEASYVTGDSMVRDCTVQRTWMRPGMFMEEKDITVREELLSQFPDGCLTIMAGEAFVLARNENMDDHLTVVQAFPGSGMNRLALCSKLLSVQKRVNNWLDLLNDYFIRTVPQTVRDVDLFNMDALRDQGLVPGGNIGVKRTGVYANPMVPLENGIYVEPTPTPQPTMPDTIKFFLSDLPQLLVGAMPSLFGSGANTDTNVGSMGYAIQRDQALGRLGTPWHAIQMATCNYFRQAVQLAARCRKDQTINAAGHPGEAIRIELSDLKGNVLTFPVEDSNFPESWNQRQTRYQQMVTEAATNPFIAQLLANAANARLAHDSVGMQEFIIPQADAWEKQMGEFEVLLAGAPLPNPQKLQMAAQIQQATAMRQPVDPAMLQQIAGMPDMIPSVPIDPETDDNATEAECCLWKINSPEGRKLKNGTQAERDGYANLRLHWKMHADVAKQNAPPPAQKPASVSMNVKDMPPRAAAAEYSKRGLPATPAEVTMQHAPKQPVEAQ